MKNFMQFMIPLLVIIVIGFIMFRTSVPEKDEKKLYVNCNGSTKSYEVYSGFEIDFMPKSDACKLSIEINDVSRDAVKLNTTYLWRLNVQGEIDVEGPRNVNIIETGRETILYSYDQQTKFTFEYK